MSGKPVVPRARARQDIEEAVDHYRAEAGEAVALGFVDALEAAFAHIGAQPASGSLRYAYDLDLPGLRVWPLRRYPWLIFYRDVPDSVDVWRVLHEARDVLARIVDPAEEV